MRLLCALGLFLALLHVTSCAFRIGAFNIQNFGPKKTGILKDMTPAERKTSEEVMETIKKIVHRYDIILIQEVLDSNKEEPVTNKLMDLVNQGIAIGSPNHFEKISSDPLPLDGTNKERYVFLYKDQTVTVEDKFQYNEGKAGVFDRPPFIVKFSSTQTAVKEFALIPIHTSPLSAAQADEKKKKSTVEQLKALVDVVKKAKDKWKNDNIMVLGDFNAGGTYVKDKEWKDILLLFSNNGLHCLINDGVDTTLAKSSNTYDRIVVTTEMEKGVVKAEVFNFMTELDPVVPGGPGLSQAKAEKVSDHFPVEVELKLSLKRPGGALVGQQPTKKG